MGKTNYLQHSIFNISFSIILSAIFSSYYWQGWYITILGMLYSTFWMSPDMDSSRARVYKNWWIFKIYWLLYTAIFKHRGPSYNIFFKINRGIGHNLILGTVFRVLYASPLFIAIFEIINFKPDTGFLIRFIFGIWLADALHILLDEVFHR